MPMKRTMQFRRLLLSPEAEITTALRQEIANELLGLDRIEEAARGVRKHIRGPLEEGHIHKLDKALNVLKLIREHKWGTLKARAALCGRKKGQKNERQPIPDRGYADEEPVR